VSISSVYSEYCTITPLPLQRAAEILTDRECLHPTGVLELYVENERLALQQATDSTCYTCPHFGQQRDL